MGHRAQEFPGVILLLQRIRFRIGPAVNRHRAGMHFRRLPFGGRRLHDAVDRNAATGGQTPDFTVVIRQLPIGDNLQIGLRRAVVQFRS